MSEKSKKQSGAKEMCSALTVNERARVMVIALAGQRNWSDTREAWLSRPARATGLSLRRVKAIFYQEPIRLGADEYVAIQSRFDRLNIDIEDAYAALAPVRELARNAGVGPSGVAHPEGERGEAAVKPASQPTRTAS